MKNIAVAAAACRAGIAGRGGVAAEVPGCPLPGCPQTCWCLPEAFAEVAGKHHRPSVHCQRSN
jgi:hypothetical protein